MNILITSIGRRSYMVDYFKKSMSSDDEVHAMNSDFTYALAQADSFIISPSIYDDEYLDFVLEYCKNYKIDAVISLFDIDLPVLAKHRESFELLGVKLLLADFKLIEVCNDKWETYNFLKDGGFNVPRTYLKVDDVKKNLSLNEIEYPLIVKPRWGMGSIGISIAKNENELMFYYNKTLNTIADTYLKYESAVDLSNSVIIQEFLDGQEYGLDVFNSLCKEYLTTVPKVKLAMRAGETDIAKVINDKALSELGRELSNYTKHIGNLDVDVFKVGMKYYILEINARFGGQYPFSHAAGVNFPQVIVDQLKGNLVDPENLDFKDVTVYKDFKIEIV